MRGTVALLDENTVTLLAGIKWMGHTTGYERGEVDGDEVVMNMMVTLLDGNK